MPNYIVEPHPYNNDADFLYIEDPNAEGGWDLKRVSSMEEVPAALRVSPDEWNQRMARTNAPPPSASSGQAPSASSGGEPYGPPPREQAQPQRQTPDLWGRGLGGPSGRTTGEPQVQPYDRTRGEPQVQPYERPQTREPQVQPYTGQPAAMPDLWGGGMGAQQPRTYGVAPNPDIIPVNVPAYNSQALPQDLYMPPGQQGPGMQPGPIQQWYSPPWAPMIDEEERRRRAAGGGMPMQYR